jgi:hypothetical protein
MLTLEDFNKISDGRIFAIGILPNSPEGLYMESAPRLIGKELIWLAKKGFGNDWSIYTHWREKGFAFVETNGDKITGKDNILKCVKCSNAVLKLYRM